MFTNGYIFTPRLTIVEAISGATIRLLDDDMAPSASIRSDEAVSARVTDTMAVSASIDSFPAATVRRVSDRPLLSARLRTN